MAHLRPIIVAVCLLWGGQASAQQRYVFAPGPDLWYNSVDGLRLGLRVKGQMAGTFGDGPHRLDLGLWLGSKLPKDPVSYYVSLTEPIPAWSDFGSEAALMGFSSIREGLHAHGLTLRKRWQHGFSEREYVQALATASYRQRFDPRYPQFPQLWQARPVYQVDTEWLLRRVFDRVGVYSLAAGLSSGWVGNVAFTQLELEQQALTSVWGPFRLGHRLFLGVSGAETPVESRYRLGGGKALDWVGSGITRSRGTLPQTWMRDGWISVAGGPNLRAYHRGEINRLDETVTHASVAGANLELELPDPLGWLLGRIPMARGLLQSKFVLFQDFGAPLSGEGRHLRSDAGLGFALGLDLPEYLGRNRFLSVRYDVPFWMSHPETGQPAWKYRSVIGIWSIISL